MDLILHIGTEKTGTTILQNWLYENADTLSSSGFFLCQSLGVPNNRLLSAYFQSWFDDFFIDRGVTTVEGKLQLFEGFAERLDAEILEAAYCCDTCIMTSEHLSSRLRSNEEVHALASFLLERFRRVRVVCYFRDQESLRQSLFSTSLVGGNTGSLSNFMADVNEGHYYFNYHDISVNWARNFPAGSFCPVLYSRDSFPGGDVRRDFANRFGLPAHLMSFNERSANESLSEMQALLLRLLNNIRSRYDSDGKLDVERQDVVDFIVSDPVFRAARAQRSHGTGILSRFTESNRKFVEEFLPEASVFLLPGERDSSSGHAGEVRDVTLDSVEELVSRFIGLCEGRSEKSPAKITVDGA